MYVHTYITTYSPGPYYAVNECIADQIRKEKYFAPSSSNPCDLFLFHFSCFNPLSLSAPVLHMLQHGNELRLSQLSKLPAAVDVSYPRCSLIYV